MSSYIKESQYLGEKAIVFGNSQLEAVLLPGLGSNLISLKLKSKDADLLRVPESKAQYEKNPVLYGMPILFPPNRIDSGIFTYDGQTYQLTKNEEKYNNHLHGFLYDKPWKVLKQDRNGESVRIVTEINSDDFTSITKQFPHSFSVKMTYTLDGGVLSTNATISNHGTRKFPWGLGYHTTFNLPISADGALENCTVSLPVDEHWMLNERMLPTGEIRKLTDAEEFQQGILLSDKLFDDVYGYAKESELVNEAVITDHNEGIRIHYKCDKRFGHWVLFNGNGKDLSGFVCPEPYTWVTDAPNVDLPDSVTGFRELKPGEEVNLISQLIVDTF